MAFAFRIRTDKDVDFTGAIAQNAAATANLVLNDALRGINGNARSRIRAIALESDQNLAWDLLLFTSDGYDDTNLDLDTFAGRWSFSTTDGVQIAGAGQYYYYIDSLDVPYTDDDNTGELHLMLVNRSATGKNAGATGEIVVVVTMEPMVVY